MSNKSLAELSYNVAINWNHKELGCPSPLARTLTTGLAETLDSLVDYFKNKPSPIDYVLLGEVEFNKDIFHPAGMSPTYLWAAQTKGDDGMQIYELSPSNTTPGCGECFLSKTQRSLVEFLKFYVSLDERIGNSAYLSFQNAKIRLKGLTEWITN